MKLKISILVALAVIAFPFAAQAQDTNSYESLNVSCESGAECSDFGVNFKQEGDTVAQTRRTRTRRTRRSSDDSKAFVGGTLGVFFPSEIDDSIIDPGTGFGGSVFGGYKFTDLIAAEAEASLAFGGSDDEDVNGNEVDGSYTLFTLLVGPRFTYTIDQGNDRSFYVFSLHPASALETLILAMRLVTILMMPTWILQVAVLLCKVKLVRVILLATR